MKKSPLLWNILLLTFKCEQNLQINELKTTEHICLYLILRNHLRTLDGCVRFLKKRFVEFSKQPVLTGTTSVQPAECAPALSTKFAFNIFLLLPFLFNCGERNNAEYCKQEDAVTQFRYLSNKLANRVCFRSPLSPLRAIFWLAGTRKLRWRWNAGGS